jgi:polyphosphate kinase 2 (PPK2 family)
MEMTMGKKSAKTKKGGGANAKATKDDRGAPKASPELSGKDYDRELKKLHVELVKLQQWVVHKGLKVCIIF